MKAKVEHAEFLVVFKLHWFEHQSAHSDVSLGVSYIDNFKKKSVSGELCGNHTHMQQLRTIIGTVHWDEVYLHGTR